MNFSVSLIGTGNVAWHLAQHFTLLGIDIREVAGRNQEKTNLFAQQFKAKAIDHLSHFDQLSDLYIICVSDDQIRNVAQQLAYVQKPVLHTSGATPMSIFENCMPHFGVLYPLQTFKIQQKVSWEEIPVLIEANNENTFNLVNQLANRMTPHVHFVNSEQRLKLHTAAVFVSNFVNYLYITAQDITQSAHLPFSILTPLIQEVANKIKHNNPLETQTGPAIRNDKNVQEKHLALLNSEQKEIYSLLSQLIHQRFSSENKEK